MTGNHQPTRLHADQEALEKRLGELHRDLAELYRLSVSLLATAASNKGALVLLAHAVREIVNNLAHQLGVAEGFSFPPSVDTATPMGALTKLWTDEGPSSGNSSKSHRAHSTTELSEGHDETIRETSSLRITKGIYQAIEMAIAAHSSATGNARQRQAFIAIGTATPPHDPTATLFGTTYDFFMGYAHLDRANGHDLPTEHHLQNQFANFEAVVSARLGGFFEIIDELTEIINVANAKVPDSETPPQRNADTK
ncbi:hypothetical protein ACWERV_30060 [Streptomyces sp. NPDC004031]